MASNMFFDFDSVNFVSGNIYGFFILGIMIPGIIIIIILTFRGIRHIVKQEKEKDEEKNEKSKKELEKKLELSEKIGCLKHLSKIHRSQFDERRKIEWKLIFAILVFYFGIITAKIASNNTNIIEDIHKFIISFAFFSIAAIAIFYLTYFHLANQKNKSFAQKSENAIRDYLKDVEPNFDIFEFKWEDIWSNWSFKMQFALLFSMAFCSSVIIWI